MTCAVSVEVMQDFEQVTKRYPDGTTAVDGLSFEVAEGELVTLVTVGLRQDNDHDDGEPADSNRPRAGSSLNAGQDIATVDPVRRLRRRIGYLVVQQVGLFPHRTILDNPATVPTLIGWKKAKARDDSQPRSCSTWWAWTEEYGSRYPERTVGSQRASGSGWPGRSPPIHPYC